MKPCFLAAPQSRAKAASHAVPGVVEASTSAAAQSKSVETENEDVISKGCVKLAVARFGEVLL